MIGKLFKKKETIEIKNKKTIHQYNQLSEDLYERCQFCQSVIYKEDLEENLRVCPKCFGHMRISPRERIKFIFGNAFKEYNGDILTDNPIDFDGYEKKITKYVKKTNENSAVTTGVGEISGFKVAVAIMNPFFMMGSMGSVVGEKITRIIEYATQNKMPVIIFNASGGARMQEGVYSLMQMAKVSGALKKHHNAGQLYISVLTDPTTGGVSASFAMLGDIILAEPKALIGFAGPRVIEQTIKQALPEGFQRSEFLLEKGFVDRIVPREDFNDLLIRILKVHQVNNDEE